VAMPEPLGRSAAFSISSSRLRIASTTPWTLIASWRSNAAVHCWIVDRSIYRDGALFDEMSVAGKCCDVLAQLIHLRSFLGRLVCAGFDALGF